MMIAEVARYLFTVDDFQRMAEAGVLREDARVELIEGEVIEMSPIGGRHAACVDRIARLCFRQVGESVIVRVQGPLQLAMRTQVQPDISLLRPRDDFYEYPLPAPADVLAVVEVAETSVRRDRGAKLALYAQAGIPEVWLVDLPGQLVELFAQPTQAGYAVVEQRRHGETLTCRSLAGLSIDVAEIL